MFQLLLIALFALFLTACESNPPAPVVDRLPQSSKPATATKGGVKTNQAGNSAIKNDGRPNTHTVKKGDTLFSIGLEYGLEYKEIAATNNITPPYTIEIGQILNLAAAEAKSDGVNNDSASQVTTEDGVVITPIKTDSAVIETTVSENKASPTAETKPTQSVPSGLLTEPKAIREPYSLEAFNRTVPVKTAETKVVVNGKTVGTTVVTTVETKVNEVKAGEIKPAQTPPAADKSAQTQPTDDEDIKWSWPTQGKVVASFNEATNKGLDISGSTGQAINAASSGKVIYSGSDLRGYGKLVIIKHNKTYLSVYAHNSKIIVKEGQVVGAGQKIAEMGNTDSNTVKLHFEIRRLGKSVDPAKYLNQN